MKCGSDFDPVRISLVRNALEAVTDLMSLTLVRTARSQSVRSGWDFFSAILSPAGDLIGQGLSQPLYLAGMMPWPPWFITLTWGAAS